LVVVIIESLATVITNLLSAIPWIGTDFVEFVSILLTLALLPTIGIVRTGALRGTKARTLADKMYSLDIPYQFLSMLVGLIDGDGYIQITRAGRYVLIQLVISLHIDELPMLEYIRSVIKVGT
jgi:hypothetical protein